MRLKTVTLPPISARIGPPGTSEGAAPPAQDTQAAAEPDCGPARDHPCGDGLQDVMSGRLDRRERSENFSGEILRSDDWRVAVSRDGIQWLLQHRRTTAQEGATAAWDNVSFCQTRAALLRLWRAHTGGDGAGFLEQLPERSTRVPSMFVSQPAARSASRGEP